MKQLFILIITVAGFAVQGVAQSGDAISKYFSQYVDDDRFSMVYISPKMFDLVSRVELESDDIDPEVMEIVKELKGLRILSYEGTESQGFYSEARKKIDLNKYEPLIQVRDGDENVHIAVASAGNIVSELLLLVGGDDNFVLMSFIGNIDLKKVGKLGSLMDIEGVKHLEKIDKDKH